MDLFNLASIRDIWILSFECFYGQLLILSNRGFDRPGGSWWTKNLSELTNSDHQSPRNSGDSNLSVFDRIYEIPNFGDFSLCFWYWKQHWFHPQSITRLGISHQNDPIWYSKAIPSHRLHERAPEGPKGPETRHIDLTIAKRRYWIFWYCLARLMLFGAIKRQHPSPEHRIRRLIINVHA